MNRAIKVVELYRHPVKSFTPERCDELSVADGKIQGDRVLGFRFADQGAPDDWAWRRKSNFVALSNTPGLPRLDLKYDAQARVLSFNYEGDVFVRGSIDSEEDRFDISEAIGEFVTSLEINPLVGHPERVPLNLIGDGRQGLFHDSQEGGVTLHSRESLKAFQDHLGSNIDGRRFRTNVVVEGAEAWEEIAWTGSITIGESRFEVVKPVPRCLATHANPATGDQDLEVMKGLIAANGHDEPTFAVRLNPVDANAKVRVGDSVSVR